jgi:hypothetical protein
MHAWAIVAVLILALAGCEDEDEEGLSKQDYVAKADAICADTNRKEINARFLTTFNAVARTGLRRLRALNPPEEDRQAADKLPSSLERVVASVDEAIAAIRARENERHAPAARDNETAYSDVAASTAELGLSECQGVGN